MPREKPPSEGPAAPDQPSEAELLARELADVRPLVADERVPLPVERPGREQARVLRQAATETTATDRTLEGSLQAVAPVAADARIEFHRPGLQLRQWQKLKQGAIPWQLGVDLHGTTRAEALRAVDSLIREAQADDANCIRVVHGKGYGGGGATGETTTIKAELNHWLRRHEQVLAFCSALPGYGGAGALYILLRRRRD